MKICYITAKIPWGRGETFILEEMLEVQNQGAELVIIPRNPSREVFHAEAEHLIKHAIWLPLLSWKIILFLFPRLFYNLRLWGLLIRITHQSRSVKIMMKNLAVVPKAVYVSSWSGLKKVNHIHAHWGSTTATMAYIVSGLTDIPWSMTLHRWDIAENNLLAEKIRSAKFVVAISEHGKNELFNITGSDYQEKIGVLHLGVKVPEIPLTVNDKQKKTTFTIAVPANLVEVKGHKYLVEACFLLVKQGIKNFQCFFYGDGPLREKLANSICERNLGEYITLPGVLPHEELIKMYETKSIDLVVLPSIVTGKGECEGIPVSLMEAMACGIPALSTFTGGIPELLGEGAGLLVEPSSSKVLAETIAFLIQDADIRDKLRKKGYERVKNDFNINLNVQRLLNLMENGIEGK